MNSDPKTSIGAVAIGRNEGGRLVRCLNALVGRVSTVVYVDSGSDDGSVDRARELGAEVVALDTAIPFTAARARNAGLARLLEMDQELRFVQFVDGDCEVRDGWLGQGAQYLAAHEDMGVVCGRRRERYPDASVYNRLCDMEWDTPVGEAEACHGDAMMRVDMLRQLGGFREDMIAGEEPELCVRLRRAGWRVMRLAAEMTYHDASMTRFGQWWRRAQRAGHAFAEGAWLHGRSPQRHNVRPLLSICFWGGAAPVTAFALAWPTSGASLLLLVGYGVLWWRVYRGRRRADAPSTARLYATMTVLGKFAQLLGVMAYVWRRHVLRRKVRLIEYKQTTDNTTGSTITRAQPAKAQRNA